MGTVTRTHLEQKGTFFQSVMRGGKALVASLYTFVLWTLSNALAHPALMELFLLLLILYTIYRIARRLGRRRTS
jgi:hypothetical protein